MNLKLDQKDFEQIDKWAFDLYHLNKALKQSLKYIETKTTHGCENVYLTELIEKKIMKILEKLE